jgi:2-(1,2-epoxy-1,2-dihydrophenyl)acetyl-CoA isomerase
MPGMPGALRLFQVPLNQNLPMHSNTDTVILERIGEVARVTLNRPDKYNSLDAELALGIQHALDQAAAAPGIRALYLTGEGRAFCAGQDLQEIIGPEPPAMSEILGLRLNPIVERLRALPIPVVCGVNGAAAGAGANIALACDITLAAESAYFLQAFSKIGLIPDTGGTFFLPRLVGRQKAAALMMLADKVSARQAEAMGMIYQVLPDERFQEEALAIASRLAHMPTRAMALIKQALDASAHNTLAQQLQLEETLQIKAGATFDYQEGVKAFVEKRAPQFRGA